MQQEVLTSPGNKSAHAHLNRCWNESNLNMPEIQRIPQQDFFSNHAGSLMSQRLALKGIPGQAGAEMGKNLDSWILILILEIVLDFDFEN